MDRRFVNAAVRGYTPFQQGMVNSAQARGQLQNQQARDRAEQWRRSGMSGVAGAPMFEHPTTTPQLRPPVQQPTAGLQQPGAHWGNSEHAVIGRYSPPSVGLSERTLGWDRAQTPYDQLMEQAALENGLDPQMFKRLIGSESSFRPDVASPRGADYGLGIAQIAAVHGLSDEDRRNPEIAIPFAARLLRQKLDASGGDLNEALMKYKGASSEQGRSAMAPVNRDILAPVGNYGPGQGSGGSQAGRGAAYQAGQYFRPERAIDRAGNVDGMDYTPPAGLDMGRKDFVAPQWYRDFSEGQGRPLGPEPDPVTHDFTPRSRSGEPAPLDVTVTQGTAPALDDEEEPPKVGMRKGEFYEAGRSAPKLPSGRAEIAPINELEFYRANPNQVTGDMQHLMQRREQLARQAQYYAHVGTPEMMEQFFAMEGLIHQTDIALYNLQGMQGIQELTNMRDPRRLSSVWSHYAGGDVQIIPRTDGTYDVEINGVLRHEGMTEQQVVSQATLAFSAQARQEYQENISATRDKMREFEFWNAEETVKAMNNARLEILKGDIQRANEFLKPVELKVHNTDSGTLITRGDQVYQYIPETGEIKRWFGQDTPGMPPYFQQRGMQEMQEMQGMDPFSETMRTWNQ